MRNKWSKSHKHQEQKKEQKQEAFDVTEDYIAESIEDSIYFSVKEAISMLIPKDSDETMTQETYESVNEFLANNSNDEGDFYITLSENDEQEILQNKLLQLVAFSTLAEILSMYNEGYLMSNEEVIRELNEAKDIIGD